MAGLEAGWLVVFEPKLRLAAWPDKARMIQTVRDQIPLATLVKANLTEATELTGAHSAAQCSSGLVALGAEAAVVTSGIHGFTVAIGTSGPVHEPAVPAAVADASGAGDALAGVMVAALHRVGSLAGLQGASGLGARVAAAVTEARGATAGLPATAEARAMLDAALAMA